jgi:hypothetical protein
LWVPIGRMQLIGIGWSAGQHKQSSTDEQMRSFAAKDLSYRHTGATQLSEVTSNLSAP